MAILITGGAGYIGSHTCVELLNAGYEIIVADNLSNSNSESLNRVIDITGKSFKFYQVDLLNQNEVESIFSENKVDAVIHLAGYKSVSEAVVKPLAYYRNNIVGMLILCEMMQKYGVYRLVFSSSATVYGQPVSLPITEESTLNTNNPYGRTKLMCEEILRDISMSNRLWSTALLRYFNPIGAHDSGLIGEDPMDIPNNLLPYISQVAVGRRAELHIFGDDYPTPDGTGVRDYIHVMDIASGHVKALERVMLKTGVEAYNLGTGIGYSVLELVDTFEKVSGQKVPYRIVERRQGDVAVCYADSSKALMELGWSATRGIEEMCADSWRWQSYNLHGYEGSVPKPVKISVY